jgi:hypothetical protein
MTPDQRKWLEERKPLHLAAQNGASDLFSEFWAETFEIWFSKWPLEPLTPWEIESGMNEAQAMAAMKKVNVGSIFHNNFHSPRIIEDQGVV